MNACSRSDILLECAPQCTIRDEKPHALAPVTPRFNVAVTKLDRGARARSMVKEEDPDMKIKSP